MILLDLFVGFGRVGLLGFGGGPSMLPLMKEECVGRGWVSEEQFLEAIAMGNILPGPIATKMAVYVGWQEAGLLGALAAMLGVMLPSALLMGLVVTVAYRYREHPAAAGMLRAAKPAVVGMLAFVAFDLAPKGITNSMGAVIAVVAFVALVAKVHPGVVMVVALAVGALFFR